MSSVEEESEDEWEEVEPLKEEDSLVAGLTDEQLQALVQSGPSPSEPSTSGQGIEITLSKEGKKRSKEKDEFTKAFEALQKQIRHDLHKTHLLCLLSHGIHQSRLCDDSTLKGLLLSLVINGKSIYREDPGNYGTDQLLKLLNWFIAEREDISRAIVECGAGNREWTTAQLLVALLRVLQLRTRLVFVLNPLSHKLVPVVKSKPQKNEETEKKGGATRSKKKTQMTTKRKASSGQVSKTSDTTCRNTSPYFQKTMTGSNPPRNRRKLSRTKVEEEEDNSASEGEKSSEDEFQPPPPKRKRMNSQSSKPTKKKVLVSDKHTKTELEDSLDSKQEQTTDSLSWVEVYVSSLRRWVCLHPPSCSIGQPQLCERGCSSSVNYVMAFETDAESANVIIRDVTPRYASDWCTRAYKQRLDRDWWAESLRPFGPSDPDEKREEDEDITALLHAQPLPASVSEYKNHPLYALKRHLLKFEAIYPEDSKVLGYCRGEPVYSRGDVHMLHTKLTWLKEEGRMVRVGETACKSVKARLKKGQSLLEDQQNSTVEVFGRWQTEEYIPQPIIDGKVPRNEYGNVELFKPSMLPPGGAHINIQGIQRVARKLGVDYAPAMMGWDFHGGGFCHPIIEGIVVAEENQALLLEAWDQEEQIRVDKAMKKREKHVVERWRKFTKALLIKQRLKQKYDYTH